MTDRRGATALLHEGAAADGTRWSGRFACSALGTEDGVGPRDLPLEDALAWGRATAVRVLVFLGGRPLEPYDAGEVPAAAPYPCEAVTRLPPDLRVEERPVRPTDALIRYENEPPGRGDDAPRPR